MNLREFARQHLMPESPSTNQGHRNVLAYGVLKEMSSGMSFEDYQPLHKFIELNFDFSVFDNPVVDYNDNEAYLSYTLFQRKKDVTSTPIPQHIQDRVTEAIRRSGVVPD